MYIIISPLYLNTILLYIWFVSVEQKNKLSNASAGFPFVCPSVRVRNSSTSSAHRGVKSTVASSLHHRSCHRCHIRSSLRHRFAMGRHHFATRVATASPLSHHRFTNVSPSPMIRESIVSNAFCVIWTDIFVRQRGVNELAWNLQHQHRTFSLYLYFLLSLV